MASKGPRIADNPSFSKLREQMEGGRQLMKLRPLLRLFGIPIDDSLVERFEELSQETEEITTLPDRFNDLLSIRGWIAYEMLKADVLREVVELGEAGDLDAAEERLVDHFDRDTIEWGIKFLWAAEAFRPREKLARLAMEDYLEGRYHACVPVLLLIIDGFVNDVSKSKGFFAEGTELTAWDSVAAHSRGLETLATLWRKGRNKTTTEPLTIPYRHGILHGRDLEYGSKLVAAKLWAGLFALRAWALAVRDGRVDEPPPEAEPTFLESLEQLLEVKKTHAILDAWQPRSTEEIAAIPRTGEPKAYEEGSPERALAQLMKLWSRKNWGHLAQLCDTRSGKPSAERNIGPAASSLRELLADKNLVDFEILELEDQAAAATNARAAVRYEQDGEILRRELDFRLLYLDDEGSILIRGREDGDWRILNVWGDKLRSF